MSETSESGPQSVSPEAIYEWVDLHYSHVMTPWQLNLVKRLCFGHGAITATQGMMDIAQRVVREARAVLSAGQTP